jgi:stage III sporulation protein SpoIIIAA
MFKIGKSTETKRLVTAQSLAVGSLGTANGYKISDGSDKNLLKFMVVMIA